MSFHLQLHKLYKDRINFNQELCSWGFLSNSQAESWFNIPLCPVWNSSFRTCEAFVHSEYPSLLCHIGV